MECKTIIGYNDKKPITQNKVKHKTYSDAKKEADRINTLDKVFIKRIAYKCTVCNKYHVGTSLEMIENKKPIVNYKGPRAVRLILKEKINLDKKIKNKYKIFEFLYRNKRYSYQIKNKVVKITLPDGSYKLPKIEKNFKSIKLVKDKKKLIKIKNYINTLK